MLIAVTGARGFVGRRVADELARRNHTVVAYSRQDWDLRTGQLQQPPNVAAVVHCAARVSDWGAEDAFLLDNVVGTRVVLDSFCAAPRFIHVSSASIYDPRGRKRIVREDTPYATHYLNAYARSKMLAECVVLESGRPAIILRPHAVYGPGDRTVVPRLLAARRFGWLIGVGNGRNLLSVTHVDNLVHAIVRAVEGEVREGIFNVADAAPVRLDELLRTLLERLRLPPRIVYIPTCVAWPLAVMLERLYRIVRSPKPPALSPYIVSQMTSDCALDITSAQRHLGYAPKFTYRNGPLTA